MKTHHGRSKKPFFSYTHPVDGMTTFRFWFLKVQTKSSEMKLPLILARDFKTVLFGTIKVVFLQESKIFSSFGEFTFFHIFTYVPMHLSPLGVHHIILLRESVREHSVDGNVVSCRNDSTVKRASKSWLNNFNFYFQSCLNLVTIGMFPYKSPAIPNIVKEVDLYKI